MKQTERVLSAEEREWLNANEEALRGCMFEVSKKMRGRMSASDSTLFRVGAFNPRVFCNTIDQPPIFYADKQQFFYTALEHVLLLYVQLADVCQADEDAFTLWCASRQFPRDALGRRPPLAKRATLYMNHPSGMKPADTLVRNEYHDIVRSELHALISVSGSDEEAAFESFFQSAWRICVNSSRTGQRRTAEFCNRITTNDRDMGIVMDNVCVAHTLEVMRWLMDFFSQPTSIDTEALCGVNYACLDRAYYGPFFMIMYGISLVNRTRLPSCYRTGNIVNLSRYFAHYQRIHADNPCHFAYSAWLFTFLQSTMSSCKLNMINRDVALRVRCAMDGAEAMKLEATLTAMHAHVVKHRIIDSKPFADVLHTLQCALLCCGGGKAPADLVVTIRSTLLASIVDNIVHCGLPDLWRAALIAESAALHRDNPSEVVYIEIRQFGMAIVGALWDQWIEVRSGRRANAHPLWASTLEMVPQYGFRTSIHPSFSPISLRNGVSCFLAHPAAYPREELVLRIFEMCWCVACHEDTAPRGLCGHIPHDADVRDRDVDLCDVRMDGVPYSECAAFSGVDNAHYYLFRAVSDPTLSQRLLQRVPMPMPRLLCY